MCYVGIFDSCGNIYICGLTERMLSFTFLLLRHTPDLLAAGRHAKCQLMSLAIQGRQHNDQPSAGRMACLAAVLLPHDY